MRPEDKPIGTIIREIRESKRLGVGELANKLGVDRGAVTDWEKGTHRPSSKWLPRIAEALEVSYAELGGSPDPQERIRDVEGALLRLDRLMVDVLRRLDAVEARL